MILTSFKHSGDIGDIIYAVPTIKYLAGKVKCKARLYLSQWPGRTRVLMSEEAHAFIQPLLESQPCIDRVTLWKGEAIVYDFDDFRRYWSVHAQEYGVNLAEWHARTFNAPVSVTNEPWLEIEPKPVAKVVMHRSARYHNPNFPWQTVLRKYAQDAIFVGLEKECDDFCAEFKTNVPHYPVKDALEMARVIAGGKLFVGNQSFPNAIAEGLKKPKLLEVMTVDPNCCFPRLDAQYGFTKNIVLPDL